MNEITFRAAIETAEEGNVNGPGTAAKLSLGLVYIESGADSPIPYQARMELDIPIVPPREYDYRIPRPDLIGKLVTISIKDDRGTADPILNLRSPEPRAECIYCRKPAEKVEGAVAYYRCLPCNKKVLSNPEIMLIY